MRVRNGVDIVAVERIEKSMKRPGFMARCFSPEEQEYICRKACPAETAAALWAAKEAFGKAMGVGLSGWAMPEVRQALDCVQKMSKNMVNSIEKNIAPPIHTRGGPIKRPER